MSDPFPFDAADETPERARQDEAERVRAERRRHRQLLRATFSTPAGEALLAFWKERLLTVPSYAPGMPLDEVAHLEGEKKLVREILQAFDDDGEV